MATGLGMHHFHLRKRIHQKHEKYPHPDKFKNFVDKAVYFVGAFGIIMTLPQLMKIWVDKNASGVSAVSWSAYLVAAIFWLLYGYLHREKQLIIIYSCWVFLDIVIITGTLLYG